MVRMPLPTSQWRLVEHQPVPVGRAASVGLGDLFLRCNESEVSGGTLYHSVALVFPMKRKDARRTPVLDRSEFKERTELVRHQMPCSTSIGPSSSSRSLTGAKAGRGFLQILPKVLPFCFPA